MSENNKKTLLDIGIDVNSIMEVLIPRESKLPFEFECEIVINDISYISLYEGNRFYVKDNIKIGTYELPLKGSNLFKLKIDEINRLKVYIDDEQVDTICCFKNINDARSNEEFLEKETELRELKNAKYEFSEYINCSISSIEELNMNKDQKIYLIDKLNWAKEILDIDDVSTYEYKMALIEIENIVNPILKSFFNKPIFMDI